MPFKKGQSGNPEGPPPGNFSLVRLLKDKLQQIPNGEKEDFATKALDEYMKHLAQGKPEVWKDTFDRIDGKPKSAPDELGSENNPIHTVHKVLWE